MEGTHNIELIERKQIKISGVKKIDSFDDIEFLIDTTMGYLYIKGKELEIIKLDTNSGNITINGTIDSINYVEEKHKKESSFLGKLFK